MCSCTCIRALANLGHWLFFLSGFWLETLVGLFLSLPLSAVQVTMADAQVGRRRRVAQAEEGEHARSVRARMTDAEGRLDTVETTLGRHETRLQFIEAPLRVVLRGFSSVGEFLRVLRENDMRRAKNSLHPFSLRQTPREVWPGSSAFD